MLWAKDLAIELSLGSSKVFSGRLPELNSNGRWTSWWFRKLRTIISHHFCVGQSMLSCINVKMSPNRSVSVNFLCFSFSLEFCLYLLSLLQWVQLSGTVLRASMEKWVWQAVTYSLICTPTHFSCFNFLVFAIHGVGNSKPTVSCLLGKLVHLSEEDFM